MFERKCFLFINKHHSQITYRLSVSSSTYQLWIRGHLYWQCCRGKWCWSQRSTRHRSDLSRTAMGNVRRGFLVVEFWGETNKAPSKFRVPGCIYHPIYYNYYKFYGHFRTDRCKQFSFLLLYYLFQILAQHVRCFDRDFNPFLWKMSIFTRAFFEGWNYDKRGKEHLCHSFWDNFGSI